MANPICPIDRAVSEDLRARISVDAFRPKHSLTSSGRMVGNPDISSFRAGGAGGHNARDLFRRLRHRSLRAESCRDASRSFRYGGPHSTHRLAPIRSGQAIRLRAGMHGAPLGESRRRSAQDDGTCGFVRMRRLLVDGLIRRRGRRWGLCWLPSTPDTALPARSPPARWPLHSRARRRS